MGSSPPTTKSSRALYTKSAASLGIALGPSRLLAWLLGAAHGGAMVISILLPIAWSARLVVAALVAVSLYVVLRDHAFRRSARAIVGLEIGGDGTYAVRFADGGEWLDCEIEDSWVHPKLVLLSLRCDGGRRTRVAIAGDALPADTFRRLRVRLRLRTVAG